jgi:Fe-Mn family superoxide dismutase
MKRIDFLQRASAFLGAGFLVSSFSVAHQSGSGIENAPFTLPALGYAFNALEPHIDAMTMEIHHDRHHKAYVDNLNKAIIGTPAASLSLEELLGQISKQPAAVRNNGGGHWNHRFFWQILGPAKGAQPSAKLAAQIQKDLGGMEVMKVEFAKAATGRFGSGWAWIIWKEGKLQITSTANQDNPLMDVVENRGIPVLAIDVWEHAYYLKYQNKRADYIQAFWQVVNWDFVSQQFEKINS